MKMTVFILTSGYDYEGDDVLSVHSTLLGAQKAMCKEANLNYVPDMDLWSLRVEYCNYTISSEEVQTEES